MTTSKAIDSKAIARMYNEAAASLKDWRMGNKRMRMMRDIAREALMSDCLIGTAAEIADRYPEAWGNCQKCVADHDADEVFVWAIVGDAYTVGRVHDSLSIACIGKLD